MHIITKIFLINLVIFIFVWLADPWLGKKIKEIPTLLSGCIWWEFASIASIPAWLVWQIVIR